MGEMPANEPDKVLHELRTHELELQNEELRRAQLELEGARDRFGDLFDFAPVGYFTTCAEGLIQEANLTFAEMLDVERGELILRPLSNLVLAADQDVFSRHRRVLLATGEPQVCELRLQPQGGSPFWVEIKSVAVVDDQEQPQMRFAVSDVTDRKRAEEERQESRDALIESLASARDMAAAANAATLAKSAFLTNMSHEIRTPMNGMLGMISLLLNTELSAKQQRFANAAMSSGDILLRIINDILDFSKIEAGELSLEAIAFDLQKLLRQTVDPLAPAAGDKGLDLSWRVAPETPQQLCGDPMRLHQILTNLLDNAVKFTPDGAVTLEVSVEGESETGTRLRFAVSDSGIGIAAQRIDSLFEAFTQADTSTTRLFGGSGLGLSIVQGLVTMMGGEMEVESTEGEGSTFSFAVELARPPQPAAWQGPLAPDLGAAGEAASPKRDAAAGTMPPARVLVVEDHPVNQQILLFLLEALHVEVEAVSGGREALTALRETPYDLVLMDCQMPDMDGYETTRAIRGPDSGARNRDVPIVAVTAHAFGGERKKCLAAGMNDYLAKPFQERDLLELLRKWLPDDRGAP